jgi:hypothetical protein
MGLLFNQTAYCGWRLLLWSFSNEGSGDIKVASKLLISEIRSMISIEKIFG